MEEDTEQISNFVPTGFKNIPNPQAVKPIDPDLLVDLPPTNFELAQQAREYRENRAQALAAAAYEPPKKKHFFAKIYGTQLGIASISALITALILYIINPPLTQRKRTDDLTREKQDWRWVLITCFIVFILVFVMPEIFKILHLFE